MSELIVVVNEKDEQIKLEDKLKCHLEGLLHRAFTVCIFNYKGKLLLQRRSKNKFLWPLFWELSCSSHPSDGESYTEAGERRLRQELGFSSKLKLLTKARYQAEYKDVGSENELCALLVGEYSGEVIPNPEEVAEWKWIDLKVLSKDLAKNQNKYAPWLKIELEVLYEKLKAFKA